MSYYEMPRQSVRKQATNLTSVNRSRAPTPDEVHLAVASNSVQGSQAQQLQQIKNKFIDSRSKNRRYGMNKTFDNWNNQKKVEKTSDSKDDEATISIMIH